MNDAVKGEIMTRLAQNENVNGRGLIQTLYLNLNAKCAVFCRANLPGHFTGHIYRSATLHSCSSSDSCETSLSSLLPASASAERHCVT